MVSYINGMTYGYLVKKYISNKEIFLFNSLKFGLASIADYFCPCSIGYLNILEDITTYLYGQDGTYWNNILYLSFVFYNCIKSILFSLKKIYFKYFFIFSENTNVRKFPPFSTSNNRWEIKKLRIINYSPKALFVLIKT